MRDTYVEINLDRVYENTKNIVDRYSNYDYKMAVIKSNAYGFGYNIVNSLTKAGINYFAVSYLDEAIKIRKYDKKTSILLLQPVDLKYINEVLENNLTITVHDINYLKKLLELNINKKLNIHLKIDSGMNRLGFKDKNEIKEAYDLINDSNDLILEGIYTHFATIGFIDKHYDEQLNKFKELTSLIDLSTIKIRHIASSIILVSHDKVDFCNGFRTGTLLYGYNVSISTSNIGLKNKLRCIRNIFVQKKYNISKTNTNINLNLKPAMSLYTSIIQIKRVKAGEYIGYGATYMSKEDMLIAVLPVGYNDGIGRDNIGRFVYINNKKYDVVGNLGMNMLQVKIDDTVKINDKVELIGDNISLGQMARFQNRSFHEVLLNICKSNEIKYVNNK